jgi:cytokinesis protein
MAESRQLRQNAKDAGPREEDDAVLDNLLEKLRSGDTVTRRTRRTRPKPDNRPLVPPLDTTVSLNTAAPLDTVDVARGMLAALQRDGFGTSIPSSPTISSAPRRRTRRKTDLGDLDSQSDLLSVVSLPHTPSSPDIPADLNSSTDVT